MPEFLANEEQFLSIFPHKFAHPNELFNEVGAFIDAGYGEAEQNYYSNLLHTLWFIFHSIF